MIRYFIFTIVIRFIEMSIIDRWWLVNTIDVNID